MLVPTPESNVGLRSSCGKVGGTLESEPVVRNELVEVWEMERRRGRRRNAEEVEVDPRSVSYDDDID